MQEFVGTSLKTRLFLLVLAAFIPVSVLIFYIAEEKKTEETDAIFQKTLMLTKAAAIEENQTLEFTHSLLATLADAFFTFRDSSKPLSLLISNLPGQFEGYVQFGILNPDGRLLAGVNLPDTGEDYGNKSWFTGCLQRGELTIGEYRGKTIDETPLLYFALPACGVGKQVQAVVFTAVNLNWMNRNLFKQLVTLPEGAQVILLDNEEGIIRYDVDTGAWSVPHDHTPVLQRRIAASSSGILSLPDENGMEWMYAYAPLARSFTERHFSVVLGIPKTLALAASKRNFFRNLTLLIISALMAVLFIWWAGDFYIIRRIRKIVRVGRELAAGNLDARIGKIGVHDEIGHLAGVFDEMAVSLQTRIQNEQQVMASLEKSREQLRNLAAHQQEVRELERIRIAREIHDQFGQSLTILKMDFSWLKKRMPRIPGLDEKLAGMDSVFDNALKTIHTITAELRPVILDDFGLSAAIEWQVEEFRNRSGIDCEMENTGFEPDPPKDQATAVFRIFQELLTNILRHANARKVVVRLRKETGNMILEVQDNGRGITEAEVNNSNSYGLIGIRERLYPWHGRVSFEGRSGSGTRVTVTLPLSPKGKETRHDPRHHRR